MDGSLEGGSWVSDNDFMMYKFKVVLCNRHCDHDWDTCPFAHIGEHTCRRRDPAKCNYTSVICTDMMQKGRCPRGRSCSAAHTVYEYGLSPDRYRTEMCKVGPNCTRRICFFAHKPEELRPLPPHLINSTSSSSAGKYSLSATRQSAAKPAAGSAAAPPKANIHSTAACYQQQEGCGRHMSVGGSAIYHQGPPGAASSSTGSSSIGSACYMPCVMPSIGAQQHMGMLHRAGQLDWHAQQEQEQQPCSCRLEPMPDFASGDQLLAQLQRLALTQYKAACSGTAAPGSSAPFAAVALNAPSAAMQCPVSTGLVICKPGIAAGQQQYMQDVTMNPWQQQQQQQLQEGLPPSSQACLYSTPQYVLLQPHMHQQQAHTVQVPCIQTGPATFGAARTVSAVATGYHQEAFRAPCSNAVQYMQLVAPQGSWLL